VPSVPFRNADIERVISSSDRRVAWLPAHLQPWGANREIFLCGTLYNVYWRLGPLDSNGCKFWICAKGPTRECACSQRTRVHIIVISSYKRPWRLFANTCIGATQIQFAGPSTHATNFLLVVYKMGSAYTNSNESQTDKFKLFTRGYIYGTCLYKVKCFLKGFLSFIFMLKLHCKLIHTRLNFLYQDSLKDIHKWNANSKIKTVPFRTRICSWQQMCKYCLLLYYYIFLFTYFLRTNQDK